MPTPKPHNFTASPADKLCEMGCVRQSLTCLAGLPFDRPVNVVPTSGDGRVKRMDGCSVGSGPAQAELPKCAAGCRHDGGSPESCPV